MNVNPVKLVNYQVSRFSSKPAFKGDDDKKEVKESTFSKILDDVDDLPPITVAAGTTVIWFGLGLALDKACEIINEGHEIIVIKEPYEIINEENRPVKISRGGFAVSARSALGPLRRGGWIFAKQKDWGREKNRHSRNLLCLLSVKKIS